MPTFFARFSLVVLIALASLSMCFIPVTSDAWQVDSDTNTTSTTSYTPEKPNDILLGKISGQSVAWIALGQTSNDWTLVTLTTAQLASLAAADAAVPAANATYTGTVAKAASAVQPTDSTYTGTVALAASALQPNSITFTAVFEHTNGVPYTLTITDGQVSNVSTN